MNPMITNRLLQLISSAAGRAARSSFSSNQGWKRAPLLAICAAGSIGLLFVSPLSAVAQNAYFAGSTSQVASTYSFLNPQGVALDAKGDIFVVDTGNKAVEEIALVDSAYQTPAVLPVPAGGYSEPVGIAVDASGNAFVSDVLKDIVWEIPLSGGTYQNPVQLASPAGGYNHPEGLAVDANGNVFVADATNNAVEEIPASGGYASTVLVASGFNSPGAVAVDSIQSFALGDEMDIQNSPLLRSTSQSTNNAAAPVMCVRSGNEFVAPAKFYGVSVRPYQCADVAPRRCVQHGVYSFCCFSFRSCPRVSEQAFSRSPTDRGTGGIHGFERTGQTCGRWNDRGGFHGVQRERQWVARSRRRRKHAAFPLYPRRPVDEASASLLQHMAPAQCALVLAYLPAEWASKVLGTLDQDVQTVIMEELSQAREVPPEVVNEIEEQIKSKLPYLVGGVEWISSVYQLTQPQTQRALLGTLNQQSPELAQTLRRKTFFLEDLNVVNVGTLRAMFQKAGYPTVAMAMRDEKPENRDAILRKLPVAMREILQQELDLTSDDKHAMIEAKMRLLDIGRRMMADGRMTLPERK